jgi:tRNA(fMet)-specific endonuclease VapC
MAIIVDTDVIIAGERGKLDLPRWVESYGEEPVQLAAITLAELWHGVERGAGIHGLRRAEYLHKILDPLPVLPYTKQTSLIHARLWAELEQSGKRIGYYDLIVAATALEHRAHVATFNAKHFQLVKGLKVIQPH